MIQLIGKCLIGIKIGNGSLLVCIRKTTIYNIAFDILSGCSALPQVQAIGKFIIYRKLSPPLQGGAGGQGVSNAAELVYIKLSRPPWGYSEAILVRS